MSVIPLLSLPSNPLSSLSPSPPPTPRRCSPPPPTHPANSPPHPTTTTTCTHTRHPATIPTAYITCTPTWPRGTRHLVTMSRTFTFTIITITIRRIRCRISISISNIRCRISIRCRVKMRFRINPRVSPRVRGRLCSLMRISRREDGGGRSRSCQRRIVGRRRGRRGSGFFSLRVGTRQRTSNWSCFGVELEWKR